MLLILIKRTLLLLTLTLLTDVQAEQAATVSPMQALAVMKGIWIGEAKGIGPDRKPYEVTQTERVGDMLGGDVLIVEGRGYRANNELAFNAFGVISFDSTTNTYEMRAYADGKTGTFKMQIDGKNIVWEKPINANAFMRYTITIDGDSWHEVGEFVMKDQPARQIFEMSLKRSANTDWPASNPVLPK